MKRAAQDVHTRVRTPLLVYEAAALISWTYNLGDGALRTSTMLRKLNAGEKTAVPDEMRRWINQNGKPLVGLLRRRWAEAAIFVGKDPVNACVRAWREIDDLDDWPAFYRGRVPNWTCTSAAFSAAFAASHSPSISAKSD
jgi:lysozyme